MERIYTMKLSSVYPLLVRKAERKGRTEAEVEELIFWLMGYDADSLRCLKKIRIIRRSSMKHLPGILLRKILPERSAVSGSRRSAIL